ncbi:MarR family winged helix-turn-helix transcriptional regulator [Nocardia donostiensis]|uniref:MarR family transcriptional regulator n=1 Tax=Nocardia donostiensis TaxID=1538463 RepID=A0A1W0AYX1_9NOCA|nr:MarR family transcriptional regulator [Nocardia donostiensis]ONM48922.1 MarR family transcriptional regulator [Nocardia donostiensis]OQS15457.1 MarR family transcriptional regulator [Nocardia donostiensis]OQS22822.1 MarR family transcriptional regulator [Nocardia donostiensis]
MCAARGEISAADFDVADRLGVQLSRFVRAINRAKAQLPEPDGLERPALAVLYCLVHEGPQRTGKLAELLHAELSTISRQSASLVRHGLVERRADPIDGRACVLAATAEGERVLERSREARAHWLAEILADWPAQDRGTLVALIDRLNTGIEKTPRHPADQK